MEMNPIARNIDARMKANAMSITGLEAKAGLKPHSVRNIVTGKSKNPSAINLQAIADVLGCTVKDLLSPHEEFHVDTHCYSLDEILLGEYGSPKLLAKCADAIEDALKKVDKVLTTEQYLTCVREIYLNALRVNPPAINKAFVEWFISLIHDDRFDKPYLVPEYSKR